ncbi:fumarylacetoacetate hydrolase family protein [Brevibacterium casei]|uniref:fumarylacetoacetate hydrolase family protein n=1 Tax=Brevibacterium casei TaxID=33889 RepID=UPI00186B8CC3|nr:fumarylacetoacetate hydrolase family protein [Brevibacterium casei]MBE4696144.1 fumarylacetoacetate hydrolase family protein [Brevibacterium casei]MBY3579266.1 fumarylacetoacetate hydrolase family protein [Brevibacterium casei]
MRLATIATPSGSRAAVEDGDDYVVVEDFSDVGALLADEYWQRTVAEAIASPSATVPVSEAEELQLITRPGKIVCVGLNYRSHILEMGRDLPAYPTLFAKFAETLTGPHEDVPFAPEDPELDWEGELVVVIGRQVRRADEAEAAEAIAGYTIANDISMRGWQFRTKEWLQGKMWEDSTPLGPVLATGDDFDPAEAVLTTTVNGEVMQQHAIVDLLFTPAHLVSYISTMITLEPGDIILTGTPGGVGRARDPQVYLQPGDEVSVSIDGIGTISNRIVDAG